MWSLALILAPLVLFSRQCQKFLQDHRSFYHLQGHFSSNKEKLNSYLRVSRFSLHLPKNNSLEFLYYHPVLIFPVSIFLHRSALLNWHPSQGDSRQLTILVFIHSPQHTINLWNLCHPRGLSKMWRGCPMGPTLNSEASSPQALASL